MIRSDTTFTASCEDCGWSRVFANVSEAGQEYARHRAGHRFTVGMKVAVTDRLIRFRRGIVKHIWYDANEAVVEAHPRQEILCYRCPDHPGHPTGTYQFARVKISALESSEG